MMRFWALGTVICVCEAPLVRRDALAAVAAARRATGLPELATTVLDAARALLLLVLRDDAVLGAPPEISARRRRGLVAADDDARRKVRVAEALVHGRRLRRDVAAA